MTKPELLDRALSLPMEPGVYLMLDAAGRVLYVGKAKHLRNRVSSYFREDGGHNDKTRTMIGLIDRFDTIVVRTEFEALILENSLIKRHQPRYNTLLKDDKGYPFVRLSREPFPRFTLVSRAADDGARYFGPFGGRHETRAAIEAVLSALKLPTCSRRFPRDRGRERPCLNYHIGKCAGWCLPEGPGEAEYQARIAQAEGLFSGRLRQLTGELRKEMESAAENLEFERAAALRDRLRDFSVLTKQQQVIAGVCADTDVWNLYMGAARCGAAVLHIEGGDLLGRELEVFSLPAEDTPADILAAALSQYYLDKAAVPREILLPALWEGADTFAALLTGRCGHRVELKVPQRGPRYDLLLLAGRNAREEVERVTSEAERVSRVLRDLQQLADLPALPRRMESYDISHTAGSDTVGAMVVFCDGKPLKGAYRRFSLADFAAPDDYATTEQVLRRRFQRYLDGDEKFAPLPDVLLMDGGLGQVHIACGVLRDLGLSVPVLGMVKDERHRTRTLITPQGEELGIQTNPALYALLGRLQEEVHRSAITYHREKHRKSAVKSRLDGVNGIGPARKKALLKHFGTLRAIAQADVDTLCLVLPRPTAETLWRHLHGGE